eukprot:CAMPEP_0118687068 /NCGR_PEP_ID=MMETSP0800-20121206/8175_1 /TAXON_ID=210618 ORGANISM="Striatella unipunctata, Strain CCMP2910" /NCGR_SAMPLE_ID=MMETSP0800 /ASSEMBLY_ACC=CAM_ASM_000638 /LENGTH=109 /DNA_ID=CAMNT_0006584207 /DNA_START=57 /DNA_END=383 /DNA_ORIENTATION=+
MLSSVSRLVLVRTVTPRAFTAFGATRSLSIHDQLKSREKVEEDRYIRAKEYEAFMKKKEADQAAKAAEEAAAEPEIDPALVQAMKEAEDLLSSSMDKVSEAGLAKLAEW